MGLDWTYDRFEVTESGFIAALESHKEFAGFSLTMPLKEAAYESVLGSGGAMDEASTVLQAGNTLTKVGNGFSLFNTDVFGVTKALLEAEVTQPSTVAILGSGATSRSVLFGLFKSFSDLGSVTIFARNHDAAARTIGISNNFVDQLRDIQWLPLEAAADFGGADLTVNTLPSNVASQVEVDVPISGGWLFDVSYNPWPSPLSLAWAEELRIPGTEMLLWQALAQIRIFVNGDPEMPLNNEGAVFAAMRAASE